LNKIIIRTFFSAILLFIIFVMLVLLSSKYIFKDRIPNFFGYSILRVVSGSMEPEINIGDYVVIKKTDNYKVGEIITFTDQNNTIVTHRIVKINNDTITTKGDANNTEDGIINISSVHGKVIKHFKINLNFKKIIYLLIGIFIIGGIITIIIPNRKK